MNIPVNILFNPKLNARRKAGTLTIADHVLIGTAVFLAGLFPASKVAIGNRTSGVHPPEIGVNLYDQSNSKKSTDTAEFTFGIEITYIPEDSADRAEINHAIFLILQGFDVIQSDVGTFRCRDKASDITDGLGHVTGNVAVRAVTMPTDSDGLIITQDEIINKIKGVVI
nr:hypothetical protein [uncultured Caproiciproducens sp.]